MLLPRLNSFLEGFYEIIPRHLISIFNEQELELLISGLPNVDIDDLKANTEYHKYQSNSVQVWTKHPQCLTTVFIVHFEFCRSNGSGERCVLSTKPIEPSSCNS